MLGLLLCITACAASPRPSWSDSFSARFDSEFQAAAERWFHDGPDWRWLKAQGVQESALNPLAVSPVGARGIMQTMPATWQEIQRAMGWRNVSPHSAPHNILGGAWYQARMDRIWYRGRSIAERHDLGLASYNAGPGTILKAQAKCANAKLWTGISACLPAISGPQHSKETIGYVRNIAKWRGMMP